MDKVFLLKSCFSNGRRRTQADAGGKKTALSVEKTPLRPDNKGTIQHDNLLLSGRNPAGCRTEPVESAGLMETGDLDSEVREPKSCGNLVFEVSKFILQRRVDVVN